jgi:hypothetical protein
MKRVTHARKTSMAACSMAGIFIYVKSATLLFVGAISLSDLFFSFSFFFLFA